MKLTEKINGSYVGLIKKLLSQKDSIWTTRELTDILKKEGFAVAFDTVQKRVTRTDAVRVKVGAQTYYGAKEAITKFKGINNL